MFCMIEQLGVKANQEAAIIREPEEEGKGDWEKRGWERTQIHLMGKYLMFGH